MAKQLPKISYLEVNQSQVPPIALLGEHGMISPTLFGPTDQPYEIDSVQAFINQFGGPGTASPHFASIRRCLARGTTLWIQRLLATGATQALVALGASLITATAKSYGSWANGTLSLQYTPLATGVGGVAGTNQFVISYSGNAQITETWQSTSLAGIIALVNANSQLVVLTTATGFTEPVNSVATPVFLATGSDGTFATPTASDAAVAALFTNFDNNTEIDTLSAMGSHSAVHYANLNAYVTNRGDIMGIVELDPTVTPQAATAVATGLNTNTSQYMALYYSGPVTAYSPEQSIAVTGGCQADVVAVWAVSDTIADNVYLAPAGSRRGTIPNITSFAINLLSPAKLALANALVTAGVNVVGNDPAFGPIVFGAQTFAQSNSALDAINVRRTLTSLHQQLMPVYRSEQFQPMDPVTWRDAYSQAKTILTQMVSDNAIYAGWTYVGDQEASTISDATYNDPTDLSNGLYKVQISVVPVGYIYAINIVVDVNNLATLFNTSASTD